MIDAASDYGIHFCSYDGFQKSDRDTITRQLDSVVILRRLLVVSQTEVDTVRHPWFAVHNYVEYSVGFPQNNCSAC